MPELLFKSASGDLPVWASAGTVRDLFGVPETGLRRLVESGAVKSRKLPGDPHRAGRVYKVVGENSLSEWLEAEEAKEEAR